MNCTITGVGADDEPAKLCRLMEANMRFEPVAARDGLPQRRHVSTRVITDVNDVKDASPPLPATPPSAPGSPSKGS